MADGKWIKDLTVDIPIDEAARKVFSVRLEVVRDCLPLAAHFPHDDVEHVHQLRVGTRRANASLNIFSLCLPHKRLRAQKKLLRRLRRAAGDARDWDVFLIALQTWSEKRAAIEKPGLNFLRGYAFSRRESAQAGLHEVGGIKLEISELLESVRPPQGDDSAMLFGNLALSTLTGLIGDLQEAIAADTGDYEHLHQIRIVGKRLRYAMEIFADCFAPPFREEMYPAIEDMQDILGSANDSHVARQRLTELRDQVKSTRPQDWPVLRPGIERWLQSHRQKLLSERRRFRKWCVRWKETALPLDDLLCSPAPASESA